MSVFKPTPEQAEILSIWGRGLAVQAGAGSGKTTTMVEKCLELIRRNPEARFAAVSFTDRSASDLREKLARKLPPESSLHRHTVTTIHGLCAAILREFPRRAGCDGEESLLSEPESQLLWERALESLWDEGLPESQFQAVERLLERESRQGMIDLVKRARDLALFGAISRLEEVEGAGATDARALAIVARYVLEKYQGLKRRRGVLDFNDLERGAKLVLQDADVRRVLQARYDLLLIDEFQDTNAVQAEILWALAKPDQSNLCVVGDPKQSIYRFRDADVTVFESLCARLPERRVLSRNFRSDPRILEAVNQVCAPAFAQLGMEYVPLEPGLALPESAEAFPVEQVSVRDPAELAAWLWQEHSRGMAWGEMALLVRQVRAQGAKWIAALQESGIPIALGSGGLFWEDPRVREMAALIRWWDQPGNRLSGATFLLAPWVGVSPQELDSWLREDPTCWGPFFRSGHRMAELLRPLAEGRTVRPGELVLRLLDDPVIEAELGVQAIGLWHRLEEWASRGLGFHAAALELERCLEENRREKEVPPPAGRGVLQILTIHGSKGLEFDRVLLVDFPVKPPKAKSAPLLFWDRERGAYLARRDESGDPVKKEAPESEWRALESRKELAESLRVFYVALTRAKKRLSLAWPLAEEEPEPKKSPKKEVSPYERDHWRGWIEACSLGERLSLVQAPAPARGAGGPLALPKRAPLARVSRLPAIPRWRPRSSVTDWNTFAQCPRRLAWKWLHPERMEEESAQTLVGFDEEGFAFRPVEESAEPALEQRKIGTEVHRCLEVGDLDGLRRLEAEAGRGRFDAEPVIAWARDSHWMRPAAPPERAVYPELAFEVPIGPHILVGSMDRLVREGDAFAIIDFKVTARPKSAEALLSTYSAQLELYASALESLEPRARGKCRSLLVNFSPGAPAVEVEVPLGGHASRVEVWSSGIERVLTQGEDPARPGKHCLTCAFRKKCPDASTQ